MAITSVANIQANPSIRSDSDSPADGTQSTDARSTSPDIKGPASPASSAIPASIATPARIPAARPDTLTSRSDARNGRTASSTRRFCCAMAVVLVIKGGPLVGQGQVMA